MHIKNIIFDFGGVLYDIDFERSYKEFARIGFNDERIISHMKGQILLLETGRISGEEFLEKIYSFAPEHISREEVLFAINHILVGLPLYRVHYLVELEKKYRLYLLSNTNIIHYNVYNREICENHQTAIFNGLFKKRYYSFELGLLKPNPVIFRAVLLDSKLQPAETLFVDDDPENVRVAGTLGIHTFHMKNTSLWTELMNKLI
jgi:glucose-1-phosphatase